jgi:hypothetical protein
VALWLDGYPLSKSGCKGRTTARIIQAPFEIILKSFLRNRLKMRENLALLQNNNGKKGPVGGWFSSF